jgi:hypothetical protein
MVASEADDTAVEMPAADGSFASALLALRSRAPALRWDLPASHEPARRPKQAASAAVHGVPEE